jgi:hypothetical protein
MEDPNYGNENAPAESAVKSQSTIRMILEQVKSGEKNKSDAFLELRSILNSSGGKGMGGGGGDSWTEGDSMMMDEEKNVNQSYTSNNANQSRFSQEDRRILINKLIEKKRRAEEENTVHMAAANASNILGIYVFVWMSIQLCTIILIYEQIYG